MHRGLEQGGQRHPGRIEGRQDFSAKELTVDPGAVCTIQDNGAYSLIVVQGGGKMNDLVLDCPKMIGFRESTLPPSATPK
jgi:hypothetical protein